MIGVLPVILVYYLTSTLKGISHLTVTIMFAPITSEITLGTGTILQEISTGQLFEVGARLKTGTDTWEITEIAPDNFHRVVMALTRQELSMKFLAQVED